MKKYTLKLSDRFITDKDYMLSGEQVKLVLRTRLSTFDVQLSVGETTYKDEFNDEEPFDRQTHVFHIGKEKLTADTKLLLRVKLRKNSPLQFVYVFPFGSPEYKDEEKLKEEYDNGLTLISVDKETTAPGTEYSHLLYNGKNGEPVHVFLTEADPALVSLYIGTPNDGYESVNVKQTIPGMIADACANGHKIVTGVNADFFDMFGDHHPSGYCVKNGRTVSEPKNGRNFIALLKDGSHVITNEKESPELLSEIVQAASGLEMIVKDGQLYEYGPMEPFSYVRHPRTAAGVRKDGTVLLCVVDGRIPEYSNGASLVDLAKLMISFGADRAINMDGGGSSAMYTKKGDEFILRSRPADLIHPKAKLIRKDYNSLLIEAKE